MTTHKPSPKPPWPVPMEDEDTAPGVPPPSLQDPTKPDWKAYTQKPQGGTK